MACWVALVAGFYAFILRTVLQLQEQTPLPVLYGAAVAPVPLGTIGAMAVRPHAPWIEVFGVAGAGASLLSFMAFGAAITLDPHGCGVPQGQGDCDTAYGLGVSALFAIALVEFLIGAVTGKMLGQLILRRPQRANTR